MRRREYGEYCGLARALELVGERWGLLIIRELLARPSRYTDLLDDLPGIPTNVLSTRLKELEEAGIVERRIAPAPQRGVVYALTADGQGLEAAVLALGRWGVGRLAEKQPGEMVPPSSLAMSLRATFNPGTASGLTASWEIRAAGAVLYAVVTDGQLITGVGPAPGEPDLVITVPSEEVPSYRQILEAINCEQVQLAGQEEMLGTFKRVFTPRPAQAEALASGR
jgi:DNA-binding HxlR family transcriptional regulator